MPITSSGALSQSIPRLATRLRFKIAITAAATRKRIPITRRVVADKFLPPFRRAVRCLPHHFRSPVIFKGVKEAHLLSPIALGRNAEDLFEVAQLTTRPPTTKRLPLPETTRLKLARTIDHGAGRMCEEKVQLMSAFRTLQFQVISLHSFALSGSGPRARSLGYEEIHPFNHILFQHSVFRSSFLENSFAK